MSGRKKNIEGLLDDLFILRHKLMHGVYFLSDTNRFPASQWMTLRTIYENPGISVKDVARQLNISGSAATQLIDLLEKKGCLIRSENAEDRRSINIRLSDEINNLLARAKTEAASEFIALFDVLSDEELETFCHLSKKVTHGIQLK
jgi:MarR family transcriptional regulator, 2-MHQ and catechol-resistance regulon repressor